MKLEDDGNVNFHTPNQKLSHQHVFQWPSYVFEMFIKLFQIIQDKK